MNSTNTTPPRTGDNLLKPQQFADRLGIKLSTAYQWANERRLPTVKIGGALRFRESEVEKFVRRHDRPARRSTVSALAMGGAL